jgi:recombination protein RecR
MRQVVGLRSVEQVIAQLSHFPGIGRKSAQRMVHFLLKKGPAEVDALVQALVLLRDNVRSCGVCFNMAEAGLCWICADRTRDPSLLCVVEEPSDLMAVEKSGCFSGLYHVLGGRLSPLDGVGAQALHLRELEQRLQEGGIQEVIVATNPTVEGEATGHYVAQLARASAVRVTRLAYGLPMGGELEYIDESTLYQAMSGRRTLA